MSLSPEQIAARAGKLTASRVSVLMTGDAKGIYNLWLEMTGQPFEAEDLSRVWPVRLGECTEQLQLDWFEEKNGMAITRRGEVVVHPIYPWAAATLDGFCEDGNFVIEAKHVGGREPLETIIERYQPQIQWQLEVVQVTECALSVIMGASEPIVEFILRDPMYIEEMLNRGKQFMEHVANRTPPVALDAVPAPIDASKVYDMNGDNRWGDAAFRWLSTKDAADECKMAEKTLKAMVPDDAKKCHGSLVQITRDRAGRLSLRKQS
jgi:predicted phage-related endonuclease